MAIRCFNGDQTPYRLTIVTSSLAQSLYRWTRTQGITPMPTQLLPLWLTHPRAQSKGVRLTLSWTIALGLALTLSPVQAQLGPGQPRPELYLGVQSPSVSELQAMLRLLGFFRGEVSGLYGDDTQSAVIQFQTAAGILPNGRVNSATWSKLLPGAIATAPAPATPVAVAPKPAATPSASTFPKPTTPAKPAATPAKPAATPAKPAAAPATKPAPTAKPVAKPAAKPVEAPTFPILRKGDRGPAVETLQRRLRRMGVLTEEADGIFGEATHRAVVAAQQKLRIEADGIVGPATWDALLQ